jgi:hypothetical protein
MQSLVIDFDKLADIGLKGVRRAAVFMGLGLNAAHDPAFKSYQLSSVQNIQSNAIRMELIPSNVNEETLSHFKREFSVWVIANGLREIIERFAIFLDGIHHACQWIAVNKKTLQPADAKRLDKSFRFKGVEDKLRELEGRFCVKPNHPEYLVSINQMRNCLTHRLGKVGIEDCSDGKKFNVKWLGMEFQIELESGKVILVNEAVGTVLPEPGTLQLRIVERGKSFPLGSFASLEMYELAEVCNFILNSIRTVTTSAIEYAKSQGIQLLTQRKDAATADEGT